MLSRGESVNVGLSQVEQLFAPPTKPANAPRDAEEKILQQNAFAYDKWSVSHFLRVTSPNVHRFLKLFHQQTQQ